MRRFFFISFVIVAIAKANGQGINFNSEYDKILFPVSLGYGGGITGDDNQYKRLTFFHGHSIAFETGSNSVNHALTRMYINGDGNIGIGTTNPNSKLVISDGSYGMSMNPGVASGLGFNRNVFDGTIFNPAISAWQFSARDERFSLEGYNGASNSLLNILKNGNVGIGTISPNFKLEVHGGTAIGQYTNGTAVIDAFNSFAYFGCNLATNGIAIGPTGNVGIGISNTSSKLEVNGTIRSKEVKVEASPWPDYVFEDDYSLTPLSELELYVKENHHLPEVPSEKEVLENGVELGATVNLLLKKIEELTLYTIEQQKLIEDLIETNSSITSELDQLKTSSR